MKLQAKTILAAGTLFASLLAVASASGQGAAGSGMGLTAPAAGKSATAASDTSFATQAAKGGMAEVALGQMAQQKASSDAVKQFASHMVDDHTKANDELKQIATAKGIALPSAPPADSTSRKLQALDGAAFDKAYMTAMVADHKKTVALFEKGARARDADLKAFAVKTLPTLKDHLKMAQQTKASVG